MHTHIVITPCHHGVVINPSKPQAPRGILELDDALVLRIFSYLSPLPGVVLGILACLAVYGLFDRLLQLNLPAGPLETAIFGA